ncbi:antibiotic biosynthesis monooxygenase family protein [Kitasatospora viridis]|uniref:Antibiotic biosynthesis monooxygenase n=1 Tax=Kitasatospora viridis TaxID=281105 RepID=A0A561UBS5_9ACTN|nr:antibiotic biosynthesis monooxygenase family protein [Kitasatospora viridis]TWF96811.1 antibiotic biosynthesis monooxygenase [Kitasatospora viridis]
MQFAENEDLLVVIVLTVRPGRQQELVDALRAAGDPATVPGLRSVTLLRSEDGTRVVNQLRWADRQAYLAARDHPLVAGARAAVQPLIERADTDLYRTVSPR